MTTARQIIAEVAQSRGVCSCQLTPDGTRKTDIIHARWEAMYRMRNEMPKNKRSLAWIARQFGMDHSTVHYGIKRFIQMQGEG